MGIRAEAQITVQPAAGQGLLLDRRHNLHCRSLSGGRGAFRLLRISLMFFLKIMPAWDSVKHLVCALKEVAFMRMCVFEERRLKMRDAAE